MFTRTGRFAFCKNGPAPNILIPAGSQSNPYPDAGSLPAVNLSRLNRDRKLYFRRAPSRARNFISAGSK